jgi:hypothetical protein
MSKEYKWETMSDKDVFKMKLEGDSPHFGYLSLSRRRMFLGFLLKYGYITRCEPFFDDREKLPRQFRNFLAKYIVLSDFRYSEMGNYRAIEVKMDKRHVLFTDKRGGIIRWTK